MYQIISNESSRVESRPYGMWLWDHLPKLSAVEDRDRTWGANAEAGPAHAAAAKTAAGTSDDFILTMRGKSEEDVARNFLRRDSFCGMQTTAELMTCQEKRDYHASSIMPFSPYQPHALLLFKRAR